MGARREGIKEAMYAVYWERIRRKNEGYAVHKLGAFGTDLAALSNFFEKLWRKPTDELTIAEQAVILSWAGFHLRALGRLAEAAEPMQAAVDNFVNQKNWLEAAKNAGNLSELYLTLGEVAKAVAAARQSVDYADRSGDGFQKWVKRGNLADALHQAGEYSEAKSLFYESQSLLKESNSTAPFLYPMPGFYFCDLLLGQGQVADVVKRASQMLEWAKQRGSSLLTYALDKLSLGRAFTARALEGARAVFLASGRFFEPGRGRLVGGGARTRIATRPIGTRGALPRARRVRQSLG